MRCDAAPPSAWADRVHASSCKSCNQGEGWPHQVLTPRGGDGRCKQSERLFSVFLSIFRHQYLETEKRNQVHWLREVLGVSLVSNEKNSATFYHIVSWPSSLKNAIFLCFFYQETIYGPLSWPGVHTCGVQHGQRRVLMQILVSSERKTKPEGFVPHFCIESDVKITIFASFLWKIWSSERFMGRFSLLGEIWSPNFVGIFP